MQSGSLIRIWVKVMAFHILLGQIGINVFNFSCYCKRIVETSLIPHAQACGGTELPGKSCCSKTKKCKIQQPVREKNNCGKNKTEYKKAQLIGQLVEQEFHYFPALSPSLENPLIASLQAIVSASQSFFEFNDIKPSSGRLKRIWHCSLTC